MINTLLIQQALLERVVYLVLQAWAQDRMRTSYLRDPQSRIGNTTQLQQQTAALLHILVEHGKSWQHCMVYILKEALKFSCNPILQTDLVENTLLPYWWIAPQSADRQT